MLLKSRLTLVQGVAVHSDWTLSVSDAMYRSFLLRGLATRSPCSFAFRGSRHRAARRAAVRRRSVNADFEIKKLDSFVTQVEQLFGARATTLPGGLVLLT